MARPSKLTPSMRNKIVTAIQEGNFAVVAAQANGITEQTYYNWLSWGQRDLASEDVDKHSSIYAEFFESVKAAEAEAEVKQVRELQRDEKWQRRAWWLERRFPKRWGQKQALEVSGPEGKPIEIDAKDTLTRLLEERKDAIAEAQAALAEAREE